MTELFNYTRYAYPVMCGDYLLFEKNDGLQNQNVKYIQKGFKGKPRVLLNPNTYSKQGTVSISYAGFSKDNRYATISIQKAGSDWTEMKVIELETGKELSDHLEWIKFSGASWYKNGFFYSKYDSPEHGKEFSSVNSSQKVYYHQLGTDQSKDELIFEDKEHDNRFISAYTTEDEQYLMLSISTGTDGNELYFREINKLNDNFQLIFRGFEHNYSVLGTVGQDLLVLTNHEAANQHIVRVNPYHPEQSNWKIVVPEQKESIENASTGGGKIFIHCLKDASSRLYQYSYDGNKEKEIKLPGLGTSNGISGKKDDRYLFYSFTSFTTPTIYYKYDVLTGKSTIWRKNNVQFKSDNFESKQVFYSSKDGTKVSLFIVHKKGLKLDGSNPTILYGYGGFSISILPFFSPNLIGWLEQGGVYAIANIRGGLEYGEKWHDDGRLLKKQNGFDDFIAAAEYLQKERYTSSARLAISGGSNGGLLVGTCMTQRPDLFAVALPAVGVLDMLRYHRFTIGWGWIVEYGCADSSEVHFNNLLSYSPLHNIRKGVNYPATLVTTADHDDRVVPAHSFKFTAALQEAADKNSRPRLIRVETQAGHGAGKPIYKIIEELVDKYAFTWENMGFKPKL